MSRHDTTNFVYFVNKSKEGTQSSNSSIDDKKLNKMLKILAKQSMKEKIPSLEELEKILLDSLSANDENESESNDSKDYTEFGGSSSLTKLLQDMGYLTNSKKWLTNKSFFEIGKRILQDVMSDLTSSEFGLHEIKDSGAGSVTIDSTKKYEPGDDLKNLSVPQTILNSIQRLSKSSTDIIFPLNMEIDDFEKFETLDEVRASIVYCIDLSSTMKYSLGQGGINRIEAAKRALWSLYVLNKKFFPNDLIFIVGFASMASLVKPFDIPFLKTFDANDNFLHYTNYQAALSLSRKILKKVSAQNKRIVMITDGQPSACFVENESQKNEIISEKPYSNFYSPEPVLLDKIKEEKDMRLDSQPDHLVYLCYRYKKVDPKIHQRTLIEAKKCKRDNIDIDSIVVSDEDELLDYVKSLEKELKGKTYHIHDEHIDKVLVVDYLKNTKKVLSSKQFI